MSADERIETEPVVVDCELDEAPEKVWRALTTPELLAAWLAEGDIRPDPGHRFDLKPRTGPVECEVLEAEAGRRLRLAWRERDEAGDWVESEVSFVLIPTITGGTRLRLVHDGFVHTGFMVMATGRIAKAARRPRRRCEWALAWAA